MKNNLWRKIAIVTVVFIGLWVWKLSSGKDENKKILEEVKPSRGDIHVYITTTGNVEPQNRLEMKPPINGRVEEILVREGDHVQKGQTLARLSSTERAALLDAARPKGEEAVKYWEDAYKPTPLIAPIEGDVIVRAVEPGQSVTSADAIVVLSDRLIVKAQVDETDIGRIKQGQKARISLDAYPKEKVDAHVDHISYESDLVNNVTIYEVDVVPEVVADVFRSGMSANVEILETSRANVLRVPSNAVRREKKKTFLLVKENGRGKAEQKSVEIGLSDDEYTEIISGIDENDSVIVEKIKILPKKSSGNNPFMPAGGGGRQRR